MSKTTELPPHGTKTMSIMGHLDELRTRVIKSLVGIMLAFLIALAFSKSLLQFLTYPLLTTFPAGSQPLHFTGPMDILLAEIRVAFLIGLAGSSPFWLYQFWRFFEPALHEKERKYILPCVAASVLLFLTGLSFCFYIVMPMTLSFLIQLGSEVGTPMITVVDYLALLSLMLFGFGFVFEAPLILILLSLLKLLEADTLSHHRKGVIVGVLVVGALLTPPDPVSQVAMAIPLYLMYEMSILIIRMIEKKQKMEPGL
jgi:sec-independent protein translocase protein TatC